jgi:hypothetical protein
MSSVDVKLFTHALRLLKSNGLTIIITKQPRDLMKPAIVTEAKHTRSQ